MGEIFILIFGMVIFGFGCLVVKGGVGSMRLKVPQKVKEDERTKYRWTSGLGYIIVGVCFAGAPVLERWSDALLMVVVGVGCLAGFGLMLYSFFKYSDRKEIATTVGMVAAFLGISAMIGYLPEDVRLVALVSLIVGLIFSGVGLTFLKGENAPGNDKLVENVRKRVKDEDIPKYMCGTGWGSTLYGVAFAAVPFAFFLPEGIASTVGYALILVGIVGLGIMTLMWIRYARKKRR